MNGEPCGRGPGRAIGDSSECEAANGTLGALTGQPAGCTSWLSRLWVRMLRHIRCAAQRGLRPVMRVSAVQHLHAGATVYALDVDGRRLLLAASARWGCLLGCYPIPAVGRERSGQTQNDVLA